MTRGGPPAVPRRLVRGGRDPSGAGRAVVTGLRRGALTSGLLLGLAGSPAVAQVGTVGAGVLVSERPTEPVFELHAETPPVTQWRGYVTLSWTDESASPTVITAAERPVLRFGGGFTGLGAGLLWLEATDYEPDAMLVTSTVLPLPIPRTSVVVIGSTLPFEDFDWSVVLKLGITLFFGR